MKAVMLLSGGLDSRLAMKMMLDRGIELCAYNHTTAFCTCTLRSSCKHEAVKAAEEFGVPLTVRNVTEEFLRIIEAPEHGHGSGVNPCIDCRILLFSRAREHMKEVEAGFVVTGEVLGERPMSQRKQAMLHIEKESGLEGLVLRPLCALALEPSIPEQRGWVDRDGLRNITGRRRVPQFELAEELGVEDYPCPAGGCRLTDPNFSRRMRDLMEHEGLSVPDVQLLRWGRHFRLAPDSRAVVGREEAENERLAALARAGDHLLEVAEVPGPLTLMRGEPGPSVLQVAGALTARYSRARDRHEVRVLARPAGDEDRGTELAVRPAGEELVSRLRVN